MTRIVSRSDWLSARIDLLAAEKTLQAERDRLAEVRRALGGYTVDAPYEFESNDGPVQFTDLFDGRSQLVVYHFMFHPDWDEGCKSCSFWADSFDAMRCHLAARDTSFAVISRAPLAKLQAYQQRMGWTFPWLSASSSSFNYDFNVSFSDADIAASGVNYNYRGGSKVGSEMPGLSVFERQGDDVVHTYSTFSRGLDPLNPVYQLLDLLPRGRNEGALPYPMDWVRRHDEYDEAL